jgi:tight adherence protein B
MEVIIVAIVAGLATWLVFIMIDKRKKMDYETDQVSLIGDEKGSPGEKKKADIGIENESIKTDLIDYSIYLMPKKEKFFYILVAGAVFCAIGYIFYQNVIISLLFSSLGFFYPKIRNKEIIAKRKKELGLQFKQALYSLSSALAAGKSVENAFREVIYDLKMLYPDPQTFIIREFQVITSKIENGETIENAILDFSKRADIEDISNFAEVFITCKRTGGDLVEVIRRTANIIGDKLEIEQEISVMIAQKKFESKAMGFAPFAIVGFLSMGSGDYMAPLFNFGIGPVIMTVALALLGFSYWLTKKIMDIRV